MIGQTLDEALQLACQAVQINSPKHKSVPGRWVQTDTYERNGKGDGRVLVFEDGQGGLAHNWQTGQQHRFSLRGPSQTAAPVKRDPAKERRQREEQAAVERCCAEIVATSTPGQHPYLARKGFPDERGLIHDAPWRCFPTGWLGEAMAKAMQRAMGPF